MHTEEKSNQAWWYTTKAGKLLAAHEKQVLDDILPGLYGYHLVQCALPQFAAFVSASLIQHRVMINAQAFSNWPCSLVKGDMEHLPILHDSVDVVVLTHSLESALHPHQMLREAHRVLIPEGHVVITGLNPFSCWGVMTLFKKLLNPSLHVKMMSPNRVKDWLALLDFEVVNSKMFYFRPPFAHKRMVKNLSFLEKIGAKFWPFFGGAYVIVGVKRVVRLTPVKAKFEMKQKLWVEAEGVPNGASYKRDEHDKEG